MGVRGIVALTYLYLLLIATLSFTLFCSCLCNKNSKVYLLIVLSYFGLTLLEVIPKFNRFNPFHLLTIGTNLMYYKDYILSEHLISALFTIVVSAILVIFAIFVSRNRINNHQMVTLHDKSE